MLCFCFGLSLVNWFLLDSYTYKCNQMSRIECALSSNEPQQYYCSTAATFFHFEYWGASWEIGTTNIENLSQDKENKIKKYLAFLNGFLKKASFCMSLKNVFLWCLFSKMARRDTYSIQWSYYKDLAFLKETPCIL